MSDFFLELGKNPNARKIIKTLGLPLPMPQNLARARGPREERPLQGMNVIVGGAGQASLLSTVAETLAPAGANPFLFGENLKKAIWEAPGEAYGRPVQALAETPERMIANGLVFDASDVASAEDLRSVYDFFHAWVGRIGRCGRAIILARPPLDTAEPAARAARHALDGFVRSFAKEIGRRGATAQLVYVQEGAEARLTALLRFLLSKRSAFITGQPFLLRSVAAAGGGTDQEVSFVRPLERKVVLLTGAARGIGAATARLLAQEGAHVVCLDRPQDDEPASRIAREIGGSVLLCDVSADDAPQKIAEALMEKHGGVDVVIHNAGITRDRTLAKMKPERWDQTLDINLGAIIRINEVLLDGVIRDGGRILALSSIAGIAGNLGQTNYAASKAGVIGYVQALSEQVLKRGITVNAVAPGFIETRMTAAIPPVIREVGRRLSSVGQGGLPQDIGELLTFLATPGSQGLTGQVIRACGGAFVGA